MSATMLMPNTVSSGVCAKRLFSTTSATSPRLSSMTTRMPSLSDSSRRSEMPSISLLRTSSAMRSSRRALFTWYGSSVTMMAWRPPTLSMSSKLRARADRQAAAAGAIGGGDFGGAVDDAGGREIRARHVLHELRQRDLADRRAPRGRR